MLNVRLIRTCTPFGCVGKLYASGMLFCETIERPWLDNIPFMSCIPAGQYKVYPHVSPKFGNCFIVVGGTVGKYTGERTHILFHAANVPKQLAGCIAPVEQIKYNANGSFWGERSQIATKRLYELFGAQDSITLTIEVEHGNDY